MSFLGKEVRLARLFNRESGRLFTVAFDHGVNRGVLPGIERVGEKVAAVVAGGVDAVTLNKGIAERVFPAHAGKVSLIMKSTGFSPYHKTYDAWYADVEEAIRLGADAISMGVILGEERQPEMLHHLGLLTKEAASVGLPVIAHIYPAGPLIADDQRYLPATIAYCARVGAELGVDVVKTWYTGSPETFAQVVEACPAKVVVAGGPKMDHPEDLFATTRDAIQAGAAGVTYGRNVWQYDDPTAMVQALKAIIHRQGTPAEAMHILEAAAC
ncbi:MAG: fructose-bisphosphate aldolase, class [Clostridia bacterium]|nr:fructose-bisphosphate aldolase, class [Clostridia bacterium]